MSVAVMVCFARSGGTLLNRCLGCLPKVIILSEVSPLGGGAGKEGKDSLSTVRSQAREWYGIDLDSDDFTGAVLELAKVCDSRGKCLVIRDWSFVSFSCDPRNNWSPPGKLLTLEALQNECSVTPFAFVRDSIDVWISRGTPSAEVFFDEYLRYVEAIMARGLRIYKYEAFCRRPDVVIRDICEHTGLEYSRDYRSYASFWKVNGDTQIVGGSRGIRQGRIRPLPRRRLSEDKIGEVNENVAMIRANTLLGYPVSYYDAQFENTWRATQFANISRIVRSGLSRLGL